MAGRDARPTVKQLPKNMRLFRPNTLSEFQTEETFSDRLIAGQVGTAEGMVEAAFGLGQQQRQGPNALLSCLMALIQKHLEAPVLRGQSGREITIVLAR